MKSIQLVYRSLAQRKIVILLTLLLGLRGFVFAQCNTTDLPSGSFLMQTGSTINSGLKPYGLVYALITNHGVPVYWCINPNKLKDSADFVHNGVTYSGGTFAVNAKYITPAVAATINTWRTTNGVSGNFSVSAFNPPIYDTITSFPKVMIDNLSNNTGIIEDYFLNAGVPISAYAIGTPSSLGPCYDIWTNPHDDPTWTTHSFLYDFVTVNKGNVWAQCHLVSVLESCRNPNNPAQGLNFLTSSGLQCYKSGSCNSISGVHNSAWLNPTTYKVPGSPIMQFLGKFDNVCNKGSERWFIPAVQWNPETVRGVSTANGISPGEGSLLVYGPAFGNANNGWVMYQGGHNLNDGGGGVTTAEKIAAQRAFFNFVLFTGIKKKVTCTTNIPSTVYSGTSYSLSATAAAGVAPYTYQWSSLKGGTFSNSGSGSSVIYTPPTVQNDTVEEIKVRVTDACGKTNMQLICVTLRKNLLPVDLLTFKAEASDNSVNTEWVTASESNNDYFTVERSRDAVSYEPVGTVDGAGFSNFLRHYQFKDARPFSGLSYYRLKQTDFDGSFAYSQIAPVKFETGEIAMYPNPASGTLFLDFTTNSDDRVEVQLMDVSGRLIKTNHFVFSEGNGRIAQMDISDVCNGVYFVIINGNAYTRRQQLVVQ